MQIEKINIEVERYSVHGKRVCALNFEKGHVCKFHGARRIGTQDVCMVTGDDIFREMLVTGKDGYLMPNENCLVWKNES